MTRNRTIDILKGLSIMFVILTHYEYYPDGARLQYLFPFWIVMAVPIFMIISGYVNAASYEKKGAATFKDVYRPATIAKKLLRFVIPFVIAWILELLLIIFVKGVKTLPITFLLKFFFRGGYGKGSYYVPMLIQMVFLFPLIYLVIRKWKGWGLLLCGALNLVYEDPA